MRGQFAFERLRVVAPAREPILRDVARIDILDALERLDDGRGHGRGRELRRRQELVPLVVDRAGKDVDHAHAGRAHLGAQGLRQRNAAAFEAEKVPCGGKLASA